MYLKKVSFYLLIFFLFFLTGCKQKVKQNIGVDILGHWKISSEKLTNLLDMNQICKIDTMIINIDGRTEIYCHARKTFYFYDFKNQEIISAGFITRELKNTNEENFTALVNFWQNKMKAELGDKTKIVVEEDLEDDIKVIAIHMYNGKQYTCLKGVLEKDKKAKISVKLLSPFNNEGRKLWKYKINKKTIKKKISPYTSCDFF